MAFIDVLIYLKEIFFLWLSLFIAPLENLNMLWILLPVIINWGFTEFYQEKKGTNLGNAITNGVVALLVAVDWLRTSTGEFGEGQITIGLLVTYLIITGLMAIYGILIIVWGIRLKKRVRYIGRVREVTYLTLMFTPVIYGIIPLSMNVIAAIIVFFPLFYFVVEILDRLAPDPKTYQEEDNEKEYKDKLFTDVENQPPMFQAEQGNQSTGFNQYSNYPKL